MKKTLNAIAVILACAAAFSSCTKSGIDVDIADPVKELSEDVTISLFPAGYDTKVSLDDTYSFYWDKTGESIKLIEKISSADGNKNMFKMIDNNSVDVYDNQVRASFGFSLPGASDYEKSYAGNGLISGGSFVPGLKYAYSVVYPVEAVSSFDPLSDKVRLSINSIQTPGGSAAFDASNMLFFGNIQASEVRLSATETRDAAVEYNHISSYGKIHIDKYPQFCSEPGGTNLEIKLTFADAGGSPLKIAGAFDYDIKDGIAEADGTATNIIIGNSTVKFDEFWFAAIPNRIEKSTMEVSIYSEKDGKEWIKDVHLYKPFSEGKIKLFDLDFTTGDTKEVKANRY